jgi:hypothetical protein
MRARKITPQRPHDLVLSVLRSKPSEDC